MTAELWIAALIGLVAAIEDWTRRTVSNWIPLAALGAGLGCQAARRGLGGLAAGALGAALGFAVFYACHWLWGRGAGDVKLMAGFGALLGPVRLWEALFWTSVAGGLWAAAAILAAGLRRGRNRRPPEAIPYAPAIAAGTWLALLGER
jgi:prepilin peptidase CpaA